MPHIPESGMFWCPQKQTDRVDELQERSFDQHPIRSNSQFTQPVVQTDLAVSQRFTSKGLQRPCERCAADDKSARALEISTATAKPPLRSFSAHLLVADLAARLNNRMADLAHSLLGEPKFKPTRSRAQLRYGSKGSMAIEVCRPPRRALV